MSDIVIKNRFEFYGCKFRVSQGLPTRIPALNELKGKARWVAWKHQMVQQHAPEGCEAPQGRVTKVPVNSNTGKLASVSDPSTWATYEQAAACAMTNGHDGVGVALTAEDELTAVDLDDCVGADGIPEDWVQSLLGLQETYAEFSPSGKGIRMFARGTLSKALLSAQAKVEVYGDRRYVTVTGNHVPGTPNEIRPAPKTLAFLEARVEEIKREHREQARALPARNPKGRTGTEFYRSVNDLALLNLEKWVPELLPEAEFVSRAQGYRVKSEDLGRDLQEDLSIHPQGIVDFGVHDMGDSKEGRRTAIDLVIEYADNIGLELDRADSDVANGKDAWATAKWLCEQMGVSPWTLGKEPVDEEDWLHFFNEKHCVVPFGGRMVVASFKEETTFTSPRSLLETWSFSSFRELYLNRTVIIRREKRESRRGREVDVVSEECAAAGDWWLKHPNRRQYAGITFRPGKPVEVDGELNLWRGFSVKPIRGDWSLMKQHIFEVLASENQEWAEYIIKYLAFCVQFPEKRAEVALVFRGKPGTGKGTLCNAMLRIFGQHGIHLSSGEQLMGRFNAHMRDAVLVFADEAYFPGNRSLAGTLKRYITEPSLVIEGKNRDAISVPNYLKFMFASNEEWVVLAEEHERRFGVFDVSDKYIQNKDGWFDKLYHELNNGGLEAMLYDLLSIDLTDWHPAPAPVTPGLLYQQELAMTPMETWLEGILDSGVIPSAAGEKPNWAPTKFLLEDLRNQSSTMKDCSERKLASFLQKFGCMGARVDNVRGWAFPPLLQVRAEWCKKFKGREFDGDVKDWTVISSVWGNLKITS